MDNELLVKSIKKLCQKNNISVSQLENELNFSPSLISRWKDKTPNLDRIIDISDYFNVSLDEVIGRSRENCTDDVFLSVLYDKTITKDISWKILDYNKCPSGLKQYKYKDTNLIKSFKDYQKIKDESKQISYYFEYNNGYISISGLYCYHQISSPREIKLSIQPNINAELIPQEYNNQELLPLWLKILTSLDEAPDEIKAEDLKNDFIKGFNSKNKPKLKKVHKYSIKQDSSSEKIAISKILQKKLDEK